MLIGYKRGQGSIIIRVKILNSSVATGAGLTGLVFNSSGLIISTIADNESSATAYTVAGSTIETITTLGTFAAPTATKCRFKEVDSTNHKGIYEIQIADARYAVSSAKSLLVSVAGATNAAETDVVIPLRDLDPYDSVRGGMTALPNAAAAANGGLPVLSSSATTLAYTVSTVTTVTNQLTVAQIATGVWQDTTAGDFTAANSIGKSVMNGVALGTGLTVARCTLVDTLTTYTGNTVQTGDAYARIGLAGVGLTNIGDTRMANLDATVSSRSTLTQTQVTGGAYSVQSSSCVLGDARVANLDATISSRVAATIFTGITNIAQWLGLIAGKQTGNSTARTEIRATGAGSGTYDETTDSQEALRDRGDAAWVTGTAPLDAAGTRTAVGLASANLDTQLAALQADTDNIQTRIPAALSAGGMMKADVEEIANESTGVAGFNRATKAITTGTVGSASTTTSIVTSAMSPSAAVTDQFKGLILRFAKDTTTTNLRGQATDITGSSSGGILTVTALTTAPVSGDVFTIE